MGAFSKEITQPESSSKNFFQSAIDHYSSVFLLITFGAFGYKIVFSSEKVIETFLICFLTWNVGVRGLVAFLANWISPFADRIAASYGWPLKSSFQREIAASDGAFGILGITCNWIGGDFWTATVLAVGSCWFFSELGGLMKIRKLGKDPDYQTNRSLHRGMRLDFVFSIVLFICLVMWKKGF